MEIEIFKDNNKLGELDFDEENNPLFKNGFDEKLKTLIEEYAKKGITRLIDVKSNSSNIIIEEPVSRSDPNFQLAFKEWLGRYGYEIKEPRPETDEEIKKLANAVPNEELKNKILEELPKMTYLEKTFILETLKEKFDARSEL